MNVLRVRVCMCVDCRVFVLVSYGFLCQQMNMHICTVRTRIFNVCFLCCTLTFSSTKVATITDTMVKIAMRTKKMFHKIWANGI